MLLNHEYRHLALIVSPLLAWYDSHARRLPWRDQPTSYHVWISEIMLQQTRVEAVKPYFARFISTLPTIAALAQAPEQELLKLWEGLGYYSRVRNLQKAARLVLEHHDGKLPASYSELLRLPGIGPYTAGAIASIAYGIPVPAVDGNVLRVIARLTADSRDIGLAGVKKSITLSLADIIPADRAGDFNQALMELGAMICLPRGTTKCTCCPVAAICLAWARDIVMTLPEKTAKKPRRQEQRTVFVILAQGRIALRQRAETGLLAGLWELPNSEGNLTLQEAKAALKEWKLTVNTLHKLPPAKHVFTHIEWHMTGYAVYAENCPDNAGLLWPSLQELTENFTLPSAFKPFAGEIEPLLAKQPLP